jgi:hypothetical protein
VQCAFLDFSKAFDRLQPKILLHKMHKLSFNRNLIELTGNFLSGRSQCVRFNGCFFGNLDMFVDAPQRTKLGPIFWILYINDLNAL